jgi:hypothetical protein
LSNEFPIQNGINQDDSLLKLLFNFVLEYTMRKVQANQEGMELNGTHKLLAHDDGVNLLGKTQTA